MESLRFRMVLTVLLLGRVSSFTHLTMYTEADHEGKSVYMSVNSCENIPPWIRGKVLSINTGGSCVSGCPEKACSGKCIDFYPGTPGHEDLSLVKMKGKLASVQPCGLVPDKINKEKYITLDQFNRICQTKGGYGGEFHYKHFVQSFKRARISSRSEAAKYLAFVVWESLGLTVMREMYCQNPSNEKTCKDAYGASPGGEIYYGRGPMQLSHSYNYRGASMDIFGDANVLINDPDRIARVSLAGWNSAAYFWSANVHDHSQTFGSSLKKVSGVSECLGGANENTRFKRCDHYREVLNILKIPLPDRSSDCYCISEI